MGVTGVDDKNAWATAIIAVVVREVIAVGGMSDGDCWRRNRIGTAGTGGKDYDCGS